MNTKFMNIHYDIESVREKENLRRQAEKRLKGTLSSERYDVDRTERIHERNVHPIELKTQIEEVGRGNHELEATLKRYEELYDFAPVGYFTLDKQGRILEVNLIGASMLNIPRETLKNSLLAQFVAPEFHEDYTAFLNRLFNGEKKSSCEIILLKTGGNRFHGLIQGSSYKSGQICHIAVMDITDQKRLEEALKSAKEAAESANRAKTRFLSNMSHEIRTPISGIMGILRMMLSQNPACDIRENLELMNMSANSLLTIINDILDISKIEAGNCINRKIIDLHNLLDDIRRSFIVKADEKGLVFHLLIDPSVPKQIYNDPDRLGQILRNFISNAIKFTEKGSIILDVNTSKKSNASHLVFFVRDTGIGIPQDRLSAIFEDFYQIDSEYNKKFGGTGLGLSICKKLVETMDGKIWVESQEDVGSAFFFTLPLLPCQYEPKLPEPRPDSDILPLKILLAEDDPLNKIAMQYLLQRAGHRVVTVSDGKQAVQAFQKDCFDIVIMDIQMPKMDGLEATKRIRDMESDQRHNPSFKPIPIIALTAYAMKDDETLILKSGVNAYLSKPVEEHDLFSVMNQLVISKQPLEIIENGISMDRAQNESVIKDIKEYASLIKNYPEQVEKMFGLFLNEVPERKKNLEDSFIENDMKSLGKAAHDMANLFSVFRIAEGIRCCRKLNEAAIHNDLKTANMLFHELDQMLGELTEYITAQLRSTAFILKS